MSAVRKHLGDFAALIAVAALAIGIGAYILLNQDARPTIPLIEESPTSIYVEFSDAQAVVPGQGQSVRVAGVQVGKIGGVELEDGLAVVEMQIEPEFEAAISRPYRVPLPIAGRSLPRSSTTMAC
jgi:ABC-type transporter Mla subunit MlaD